MAADAYLSVWVTNLPIAFVLQPDGQLRQRLVDAFANQGVLKVVAGPERCHVHLNIQRPYYRPGNDPEDRKPRQIEHFEIMADA